MITLEDVSSQIREATEMGVDPNYYDDMIHKVPDTLIVDRVQFFMEILKDKKVLHIGCNGILHKILMKVCKEIHGIDKDKCEYPNCIQMDVENNSLFRSGSILTRINIDGGFDFVLCGEILEHLSNPGLFLDTLRDFKCPIILTVPNAYFVGHFQIMKAKYAENVNKDHVNYYSYYTLKALVERHGYQILDFFWHDYIQNKCQKGLNEGLIFVIRRKPNGNS
jgi:2-polyprenyl-3-methyl-5-hydroxy-6-metoxy-1,4-benzoquinol methylase